MPLPIPTIVKKDLVVVLLVDLMPNVEPKFLEATKLKRFAYVKMDILEIPIAGKGATNI